jgi:predicted transcriptional regulator
MVWKMGASFEFEFRKKLTKIQEDLSKREVDVRNHLANIEKIKVETLKKTEEMKYSAQHDLERVDQDLMKTVGLDAQVKARLVSEIAELKSDIENKYNELRNMVLGRTTTS